MWGKGCGVCECRGVRGCGEYGGGGGSGGGASVGAPPCYRECGEGGDVGCACSAGDYEGDDGECGVDVDVVVCTGGAW